MKQLPNWLKDRIRREGNLSLSLSFTTYAKDNHESDELTLRLWNYYFATLNESNGLERLASEEKYLQAEADRLKSTIDDLSQLGNRLNLLRLPDNCGVKPVPTPQWKEFHAHISNFVEVGEGMDVRKAILCAGNSEAVSTLSIVPDEEPLDALLERQFDLLKGRQWCLFQLSVLRSCRTHVQKYGDMSHPVIDHIAKTLENHFPEIDGIEVDQCAQAVGDAAEEREEPEKPEGIVNVDITRFLTNAQRERVTRDSKIYNEFWNRRERERERADAIKHDLADQYNVNLKDVEKIVYPKDRG